RRRASSFATRAVRDKPPSPRRVSQRQDRQDRHALGRGVLKPWRSWRLNVVAARQALSWEASLAGSMTQPPGARHLCHMSDLTVADCDRILDRAESLLPAARGERKLEAARGKILATLFFEPSTRTRLSFETAMLRLGGSC